MLLQYDSADYSFKNYFIDIVKSEMTDKLSNVFLIIFRI